MADRPHVEQGALAIEAYLADRPHVEHGGQSIIIDNIYLKEILRAGLLGCLSHLFRVLMISKPL